MGGRGCGAEAVEASLRSGSGRSCGAMGGAGYGKVALRGAGGESLGGEGVREGWGLDAEEELHWAGWFWAGRRGSGPAANRLDQQADR